MMTTEKARAFANHWIDDWNSHDPDAIIEHYADEIEFHSPIIFALNFNGTGKITDKTELKSYFEKGLAAYPDLKFQLHKVFTGTCSIILIYTSVNGKLAAEVFEFNKADKVVTVLCHYLN